jgi:hypothetical protein
MVQKWAVDILPCLQDPDPGLDQDDQLEFLPCNFNMLISLQCHPGRGRDPGRKACLFPPSLACLKTSSIHFPLLVPGKILGRTA